MKIFLLSDLVVHELTAMQVDQRWLSFAQFRESALLWYARYSPHRNVSETLLQETERVVLRIAQRLLDEGKDMQDGSPLWLLAEFPTANYAHPLSARALSATIAECCAGSCRREEGGASCDATDGPCTGVCPKTPGGELACHPALCKLIDRIAGMPDKPTDDA
ncbi:MAG TPA: hypothetical protein VF534_25285 [Paraburkholderia sp.]